MPSNNLLDVGAFLNFGDDAGHFLFGLYFCSLEGAVEPLALAGGRVAAGVDEDRPAVLAPFLQMPGHFVTFFSKGGVPPVPVLQTSGLWRVQVGPLLKREGRSFSRKA